MFKFLLCSLVLMALVNAGISQSDTVKLINPSFEDVPQNSKPPRAWYDCGFSGESPPDVQPGGGFRVIKEAYDGNTYLGMVVRDNETWEAVSQGLSRPLLKGNCYEFSIHLCRSEIYLSQSKLTEKEANYVTPAKLRIYGGNSFCQKTELLGETSLITHPRWLEYKFRFEPFENVYFITFEVFYRTPTLFPYNGNVLLDNASDIILVPCEDEPEKEDEITAEIDDEEVEKVIVKPKKIEKVDEDTIEEVVTKAKSPVILKELNSKEIKEGQIIRIKKLYFAADSTRIEPDSYEVLDEIFHFLSENKNVIVEIGGHTNTIPDHEYCDLLSTERAKAVADYLSDKGIPEERLKYRGYGKRKYLTKSTTQWGRQQNQRVEIKILSI